MYMSTGHILCLPEEGASKHCHELDTWGWTQIPGRSLWRSLKNHETYLETSQETYPMFQRGHEEEGHSDEIDFTSVLLRALLVIHVV